MTNTLKRISQPRTAQEIINRLFEIIDARDWNDLQTVFAVDIMYERPGYPPLIGYDRVQQFYREERVIASGRHFIDSIVTNGERGACSGRFVGLHKNESAVDERFADMYTFEGGKIKLRTSYFFRPAV